MRGSRAQVYTPKYLFILDPNRHLTDGEVTEIQSEVERTWKSWLELEKMEKLPWY